jgi:ribosome-associated toxin RatA of RatAB toxin-antitoxin module
MKAIKFSERIVIDSPATAVFDYTQDYEHRTVWDTFLKTAELLDGAKEAGKDVRAYCVARNGLGMVTQYVSYNRPKATAVKMTEGPAMFKSFLGSWTFKELSSTQTEVIFLYSFELRTPFSIAGRWIEKILRKNVRQRLTDLKRNIEDK